MEQLGCLGYIGRNCDMAKCGIEIPNGARRNFVAAQYSVSEDKAKLLFDCHIMEDLGTSIDFVDGRLTCCESSTSLVLASNLLFSS